MHYDQADFADPRMNNSSLQYQCAGFEPSVSVVISTLNRATLLEKTLRALLQQNYSNFEVVVVNGPSIDHTEDVISVYKENIVLGRIDEANLSRSRNTGINLSSGELVLFLDDDAFAEPDWIVNIVEPYGDHEVGGAGTRVYDHTGFEWQANPFVVDKFYRPDFVRRPPLWAFEFSDSATIPHLLGASSSFRRSVLQEVGGFDEEIEYFLDESELCRRIVERGYKIRLVDSGASVHHQFASGITRDERRLLTHPYPVVKNKYYVALSDWRRNGGPITEYLQACETWLRELVDGARWQAAHHGISWAEYRSFLADAERGASDGRRRALEQTRKSVAISPARPEAIRKFPVIHPEGGRRTICFISRWTPQRSPGGIARYIWDLATGFARNGHETHLITATDGPSRIEFHEGLWIRHLSEAGLAPGGIAQPVAERIGALRSGPARANVAWSKAAHQEVLRLRRDRYIDMVIAPVWDQEGLYCVLDRRLNTIVSMNTTFRRFADLERSSLDRETLEELSTLEDIYVHSARLFHANSRSSADHLKDDFGIAPSARIVTVPHGAADIEPASLERVAKRRADPDGIVRVLSVSRLERRKGTDLFLSACAKLLARHLNVEVDVVGRDSYGQDPTRSLRLQFERRRGDLAGRVRFHGQLSDAEVVALYEQADIFCVPSRYESFGIIFIEAMRYRLPVVALDVGGARDIVEDGATGILCGARSAEVEAALDQLVTDRPRRTRMGDAGRDRYLRLFENERVIKSSQVAFASLVGPANLNNRA
ncbi:glycosyltransferase [Methylobacterium sp. WSM2598]|uniref:glycosyltransferase n=1 Tax=Methylobacterium sp. WSM2598 TaxID=398261 RepID=UPI00039C6F6A|nr:glycosyltransferase [Methylobacterium sp. WSM2598]